MSCPRQMREAPFHHMTLLASSDAHAEQHAALLARRRNLRSASLLRWVEWELSDKGPFGWSRLRLPRAPQQERMADAAMASLTPALHSLVVGVFVLTASTIASLNR